MVKIKVNNQEYYMDETLKANLDTAKRKIHDDWDFVFIVDGRERSGKSVMAQQMAYYVDESFCLERVTFTATEFKKAVMKAEPHQAVIYDEAFTGLSSKDTMNRTNKLLVQMMAEIGQKNLFIFIVMPTFFELTKYVALWRSAALIHVYTGNDFERGYFVFYNYDLKITLYLNGKETYRYKGSEYNFHGRFTDYYVLDEAAYRLKKKNSLKNKDDADAKEELDNHKDWLFDYLQLLPDLTEAIKMKVLQMPQSTYNYKRKHWKEIKAEVAESES